MATWGEMGMDSLRAAKELLDQGHLRSSVSRSYYAAYAALAGMLAARGATFARGWANPSHQQLPAMVGVHFGFSRRDAQSIRRVVRRLRALREDADYRPDARIDASIARICVRDAGTILFILSREGRQHERG